MPRSKTVPRRTASRAAMSVLMKDSLDAGALAGGRVHKAATFRALGSTRGFCRDADGRLRLKLQRKFNPALLEALDRVVFLFNTNDLIAAAEPVRAALDGDDLVVESPCALSESRLRSVRVLFWPDETPAAARPELDAAADALPGSWDEPVTPTVLAALDQKLQAVRQAGWL